MSIASGLFDQTALLAPSAADRAGFTVGLHLTEVGQRYGIGLNAASPSFAGGALALRASATMHYYELPPSSETPLEWSPFGQFRLGLVNYAQVCDCGLRVYGETGPLALLPNSDFSSAGLQVGWYGLFGAELMMSRNSLFFFEMGGQGASNRAADILPGGGSYGNGFIAAAGYRLQFFGKKR
jgi:hypothetical protein